MHSSVLLAQPHCLCSIRQVNPSIKPRHSSFVFVVCQPACFHFYSSRRLNLSSPTTLFMRRCLQSKTIERLIVARVVARARCVCGLAASRYRRALYAVKRGQAPINYCLDRQPYQPRPRQPPQPVPSSFSFSPFRSTQIAYCRQFPATPAFSQFPYRVGLCVAFRGSALTKRLHILTSLSCVRSYIWRIFVRSFQ